MSIDTSSFVLPNKQIVGPFLDATHMQQRRNLVAKKKNSLTHASLYFFKSDVESSVLMTLLLFFFFFQRVYLHIYTHRCKSTILWHHRCFRVFSPCWLVSGEYCETVTNQPFCGTVVVFVFSFHVGWFQVNNVRTGETHVKYANYADDYRGLQPNRWEKTERLRKFWFQRTAGVPQGRRCVPDQTTKSNRHYWGHRHYGGSGNMWVLV